jgi:hypothetical protein
MKFLIVSVPIANAADVERRFRGVRGRVFDAIRDEAAYTFDFEGTIIDSVVK